MGFFKKKKGSKSGKKEVVNSKLNEVEEATPQVSATDVTDGTDVQLDSIKEVRTESTEMEDSKDLTQAPPTPSTVASEEESDNIFSLRSIPSNNQQTGQSAAENASHFLEEDDLSLDPIKNFRKIGKATRRGEELRRQTFSEEEEEDDILAFRGKTKGDDIRLEDGIEDGNSFINSSVTSAFSCCGAMSFT